MSSEQSNFYVDKPWSIGGTFLIEAESEGEAQAVLDAIERAAKRVTTRRGRATSNIYVMASEESGS